MGVYRFIPIILVLTLTFGAGIAPAWSGTHAVSNLTKCLSHILTEFIPTAQLRELPTNSGFDSIRGAFEDLTRVKSLVEIPQIDAKRLINSEDWSKAILANPKEPWLYYGRDTLTDWLSGLRYVNANADNLPLSSNLIKRIHQITSKHLTFHGFEGRRIRLLYDQGKISKDKFNELLRQAFKENKAVSEFDHNKLRGQYRSSQIDQISHNGSSFDAKGSRYFTKRELEAIRQNAYMKVDESSVVKIGPDAYEARAYYHDVKHVDKAVEIVLAVAQKKIEDATSLETQVRAIIQMERDLISIHPFLDGNGRTVRLIGDLMYQRLRLPPPLRPNEADLVMSMDEAYEYTRKNMIDYINERYLNQYQNERSNL